MKNFTHINNSGEANMVDISDKKASKRVAIASGSVNVSKKTLELIKNDNVEKGDIFSTARIAGIMASKKTHELIPLCHNINIDFIQTQVEKLQKDLASGKAHSFTGPIYDQKGNLLVAEGKVADDGMLAGMSVYVKGVEGDIPK